MIRYFSGLSSISACVLATKKRSIFNILQAVRLRETQGPRGELKSGVNSKPYAVITPDSSTPALSVKSFQNVHDALQTTTLSCLALCPTGTVMCTCQPFMLDAVRYFTHFMSRRAFEPEGVGQRVGDILQHA